MRASFFAPHAYLERNRFSVANRRLLGLRLRQYIESESVFNEPFRLRHRPLAPSTGEASLEVDMVAVAEQEIEPVARCLAIGERPLHSLVTVEMAIAALVRQVSAEPVIILWARDDVLLALLVHNGGVLARRLRRLGSGDYTNDGMPGHAQFEQAEVMASTLRSAAKRLLREEVSLLLPLGELDARLRYSEDASDYLFLLRPDNRAEGLKQKLGRLFVLPDPTSVPRYPELYGLAFVEGAFNLLPSDYRHHVRALSWVRPVAAGAVAAAIGAALAGAGDLNRALALEQVTAAQSSGLQAPAAALARRIPPRAQASAGLAQVMKHQRNGLRVDRFLAWLSAEIPDGVTVESVSIRALPRTGSRRGASATLAGQYSVAVAFQAYGDYAQSERLAAAMVQRLAARIVLTDSSFTYTPHDGGTATLSATLAVTSSDF